uniref:Uncharacterized protein n=1 Tax=Candidatus Kentrum sp. TC TaxID=2126339 RepID=A0A450YN19_9GAMM|nr:MAG: hypothetical protein BECKTC1821D_GA0114238_101426 [Candidatus Kentron sp. TC]VFK57279.1 MAG: hypothetical protein BECKTC1821F_GA0114240_101629 [Candidatus Kentron sp. TC]
MKHLAMIQCISTIVLASLFLAGCGTMTGIPSHGGGKRFAVEQELISATARAVAKDLDVSALQGKRVAIYMVGIGDEGSGNLTGGRYSVEALVRGGYVNTPNSRYPIETTRTTTGNVVTVAENALNAPIDSRGSDRQLSAGVRYQGIGGYLAEAFVNPEDSQFLSAVLQESLVLRGVSVVGPEQAQIDVYFTVDVFGTVRRRTDYHITNQEVLLAKTALEMTAIDRTTGDIVIPPQTSSFEAEYSEQYVFWAGPVEARKEVRRSDDLLVDFKDMTQHRLTTRTKGLQPITPESNSGWTETTRPAPLTNTLPSPDPSRLEDVQ